MPEILLVGGLEVCQQHGRVAFGSRAWQVLSQFDEQAGPGAPVLIYASHPSHNRGPKVTWTARWLRWEPTNGGRHPDGDLIRPPRSVDDGEDTVGYWVGYWEATDLTPLSQDQWVRTSDLVNLHGRRFTPFVPEGPILLGADPLTGMP